MELRDTRTSAMPIVTPEQARDPKRTRRLWPLLVAGLFLATLLILPVVVHMEYASDNTVWMLGSTTARGRVRAEFSTGQLYLLNSGDFTLETYGIPAPLGIHHSDTDNREIFGRPGPSHSLWIFRIGNWCFFAGTITSVVKL